MGYNLNYINMKIPIWLKQPITQVLLYILLYELFLYVLKYYELVKLNLSIGISLKYLFYLFLFFSFILSVLLFFLKESKFSYIVILSFAYVISSIILFGITSKLIILILIISIVSFFSSYFIYNKKKNN